MAIRSDLYSNFLQESSIESNSVTADVNGASIDMRDATELTILASYGTNTSPTDGSNNLALEVEVSEDNSVWTDAPDADVRGAISGAANTGTFALFDNGVADDGALVKAAYIGSAEYVRVVANVTGTVDAPLTAVSLKKENQRPVQ